MKAGSFNIHDYIGKLYENINEEDLSILNEEEGGKLPETDGIIIPEEGKKAYDWLKKEYQKGKTEVKVEMSSHEFKPGYHLDTDQKSVKDFKPEMKGQIKTSDTPKGQSREKAIPFPETKFPGGETKAANDDKKDSNPSEKKDETKKVPKVEYKTAPKKEEKKEEDKDKDKDKE